MLLGPRVAAVTCRVWCSLGRRVVSLVSSFVSPFAALLLACAGLEAPLPGAGAMQELVAGVEKIRFDLEADVEQQRGVQPLPFPGMDSKLGTGSCSILGGWQGDRRCWGSPPCWCSGLLLHPPRCPGASCPASSPGSCPRPGWLWALLPQGCIWHSSLGTAGGGGRGAVALHGTVVPALGLVGEALPALLCPTEPGAAVCEFFHRGLCIKGECWEGMRMGLTPPCKVLGTPGSWLGPLCAL